MGDVNELPIMAASSRLLMKLLLWRKSVKLAATDDGPTLGLLELLLGTEVVVEVVDCAGVLVWLVMLSRRRRLRSGLIESYSSCLT